MNQPGEPVFDEIIITPQQLYHINVERKREIEASEIGEVFENDYVAKYTRDGRYMVVGPTDSGRMLAVVVGPRQQFGVWGLITARPAHITERRAYNKKIGEY